MTYYSSEPTFIFGAPCSLCHCFVLFLQTFVLNTVRYHHLSLLKEFKKKWIYIDIVSVILLTVYQFYDILGVKAFYKTKGFWIVSSVPRFPSHVAKGFTFSDSQIQFGQSILCVTVARTVKNILRTLTKFKIPFIWWWVFFLITSTYICIIFFYCRKRIRNDKSLYIWHEL